MVKIKNSVKKSIVKTIKYLQDQIIITEVILFGSYATGTAHKYSDIDVAVISPNFDDEDLIFKAEIASKAKLNCSVDVDLHLFKEKSLRNARPTNFIGHILKSGTVVFRNGVFLL